MKIPSKRFLGYLAFLIAAGACILSFNIQAADLRDEPLQALKVFPADIRSATAEVLRHPGILVALEKYRQVAKARFGELLAAYPQKTQENARLLVPYRKLWRGLGAYLGNENETEELLKPYSKEVQNAADYLLKNNPDVIGKVVKLEKETYQHFFQMISGLDPETQAAFKKVGQQSGIFGVLSNALNLASEGKEP